jgi:hypothetical protein
MIFSVLRRRIVLWYDTKVSDDFVASIFSVNSEDLALNNLSRIF